MPTKFIIVLLAGATAIAAPAHASEIPDGLAPPSCDYGTVHPDAASELSEFAFLIGDFTIRARPWTQDGWGPFVEQFRARLTGRYVLGGRAIQDDWFDTDPGINPDTTMGLTTRMWDPAAGEWKIAWMNTPATTLTDLRASMEDGVLTMTTVYPAQPNYDAYFGHDGPDTWTRTAFKTEADGTRTPIWQAVATRIPCPGSD
ncbi:MAG: hypothetical protein V2I43_22135 [Parvularcula sp.]|jgi:hypothetical protein|nr:hypothetical protein [Parvularcula sp.]